MANGIEMDIPKDIRQYEAKLIGAFTTRQLICTIPAIGIGILIAAVLPQYVSQDICIVLALIMVIPFLLCGWIKVQNMPFEKFVKAVFVANVLTPRRRKYKTVNTFAQLMAAETLLEAESKKTKKTSASKKKKTTITAYK